MDDDDGHACGVAAGRCQSTWAQDAAAAAPTEVRTARGAEGRRTVPFYGLYCWASDLAQPEYLGPVKETGFKLISTTIREDEEPGMLVAARNGIQMAGYFSPNRWARTMDTEGYRKAVREAVRRYGPGGSLWTENPNVPAMPIMYWIIDGEPGTELRPEGDMMPDEAYAACLKVAYEEIKAWNKECKIVAMGPIGTHGSLPGPEHVDKERKIMGAYAFIRGVHAHGGFPHYDCLDLPPFSFPMPSDTAGLAKMIRWVKEECRKHGQEEPIWFTEIGFPMAYGPPNPFHLTRDQAADYMVRAMVISARHDVQTLTLTYVNDQMSPRPRYFLYKAYGFYKDGKLRPIAKATKLMAGLLPDPVLLEVLSDGENIGDVASRWSDRPYRDSPFYCYKFRGRNNSEVYVLWTEGRPFRYYLKVPNDKMTLYNRERLGGVVCSKEHGSINADGEIRLPVTTVPLFLSTEVTPEQERATELYLRPPHYTRWQPIKGTEGQALSDPDLAWAHWAEQPRPRSQAPGTDRSRTSGRYPGRAGAPHPGHLTEVSSRPQNGRTTSVGFREDSAMNRLPILAAACCTALAPGLGAWAGEPAASEPRKVVIYTKDAPPATPAPEDLRLTDSLSEYGITWTFERPVRVGQFVNGDWYVVGPTTVVGITPKPEGGRNGSALNLKTNNKGPYDSRIPHGRYDPDQLAVPPIAMKPGDSLISTIGVDKMGVVKKMLWRGASTSPVRTAAVLTCMDRPLPPDAFRPSYCDTSNEVYLARNLHRDLLPRLERVPETPKLADFERMTQRPWLDTFMDEFGAPLENMPQYGREFTRVAGMTSLLLCLDFESAEKERLLVNFVQIGIDLWGVLGAGKPGWSALGGHGNGRRWPIIFAGMMLGEEDMQHPNRKFPNARFSEHQQTMFDKCWTGANVVYAGHVGPQGHPRHIGWGRYEHLHPSQWKSNIGENYRRCCTSKCWVGQGLAMRIMRAEKLWDHDAFFAYVDRWMTEDDTRFVAIMKATRGANYDNDWARQGMVWDPFVKEMWEKYRFAPGMPANGYRTSAPIDSPGVGFHKPAPDEALKFLKSLPRVWRNTRADFRGKKILVQLFEDFTVEDLRTLKILHPGGHVEDPTAPNRFSRRHLRVRPSDWRYFTVLDQLEVFEVGHDMDGITDECFLYLGQLPQSMHTVKLEMSEATGEGVRHLQNLKNLKRLSLNFSRTIKDVALVHAAGIELLEHLDVCGCPSITGAGVSALAKLKNLKVLKIGSCSLSNSSLRHFVSLRVEELDMSHVEKGWIVEYRGGGRCRFTVSYDGLRALLITRNSVPNLKRLVLKDTKVSPRDKDRLAKLRPGLRVL